MWLEFVIFGGLLGVTWSFVERPTLRHWMRVTGIACSLGLFAVALYLNQSALTLGADDPWYRQKAASYSIWFIAMLFGMTARYLNEAIEARNEQIARLSQGSARFKKPKLELDKWSFARPLLFSVVTFGALLSQISSQALTIESIVLSFQSGFFWQTLLANKEKSAL